jgi:ferredoxin
MSAVTRNALAQSDAPLVDFTLNGQAVSGKRTDTIIQIAQRAGIEIPHLCYQEDLDAAGNCRACMVEIKGERVLAPSCCRHPSAGMEVSSDSPRARKAQQMVLELLQSDMPETAYTRNNELDLWAQQLQVGKPRFKQTRATVETDLSHPAIAVNLDACIQCTRCVRACRDEQVNDVIGLVSRRPGEDRVRHGRYDGRLDLRRLRRVRASVPDRRADAGAQCGAGRARQERRFGLPVLRGRLPADLPRPGQQNRLRRRARRPGQPRPAVRQGALRLRLCAPSAAPDGAADPARGRA